MYCMIHFLPLLDPPVIESYHLANTPSPSAAHALLKQLDSQVSDGKLEYPTNGAKLLGMALSQKLLNVTMLNWTLPFLDLALAKGLA